MTIEVKVTVTTLDGEVLDTRIVNDSWSSKAGPMYSVASLAQSIVVTLEENFEVREE